MNVSEVMTRHVTTVRTGTSVADAVRLMLDRKISGLPVVDANGALVGIVTEGDFLRRGELGTERHRARWIEFLLGPGRLAGEYVDTHGHTVEEVMTREVFAVSSATPLRDAVQMMERQGVKRLPVVDADVLTGILSRADVMKAFVGAAEAGAEPLPEDADMRGRIVAEIARQPWSGCAAVRVAVDHGVVELHGVVTDERARAALIVLAENTRGVKRVRDELTTVEPITGTVVHSPSDAP